METNNNLQKSFLNLHKSTNKQEAKVAFTGHKVLKDEEGLDVYRFYLPKTDAKTKIQLEIMPLTKDDLGNYVQSNVEEKETINFAKDKNYHDVYFEDKGLDLAENKQKNALGYRFLINGKAYNDTSQKVNLSDAAYNIATPPSRTVLEQPRSMYHILPDLFVAKKDTNAETYEMTRTHFNKLGGSIEGVLEKLDYISDLGAKRILSTPIFGQDQLSSHGYWTTNPYQITDNMGDSADFKNIQVEMFKKGMGWVADGAFVNEGLEGIHTKHVIKWGEDSPFVNWLDTHNYTDEPLKFGILPKKEEARKHMAVRIINSPENKKYDTNKPTFVQIYDKRLASDEQLAKDEPIRQYAKSVEDSNAINDYMDAVNPYCFEIKPEEVDKAKKLEFSNFKLTASDKDGGTTLWDGNKDISKLRFMTPEFKNNELGKEELKTINIASTQVQDYVVQVGKFWTNETSKSLQTYIASDVLKNVEKSDDAKEIASILSKAVNSKDKDSAKLPDSAKVVTVEHLENLLSGNYHLETTPVSENITDGLMDFPFEAIEFDSGLTSILGTPFIKKLAQSDDQIDLSRYELYQKSIAASYEPKYEKIVPERYQTIYAKMDNIIVDDMTTATVDILKDIDETGKLNTTLVEKNNLTENGKIVYGLISNDIAKYLMVKSLAPQINPNYENKNFLEYNIKELNSVSAQSIVSSTGEKLSNAYSAEAEANMLTDCIKDGLDAITTQDKSDFAQYLATRLEGVDANKVKVAQLILAKTESGLEWRIDAAKDVMNKDELEQGKAAFEPQWNKAINFWQHFTKGVKQYNPNAYMIGELTNIGGLIMNASDNEKNIETRKYKNTYEAENKFIQETGFTTQTNYNYLYSAPQTVYGAKAENGESLGSIVWENGGLYKDLLHAWGTGPQTWSNKGFLYSGSQDNVLYSHSGISNHDKPRANYAFGLDMDILYQNPEEAYGNNDKFKENANYFYGINSYSSDIKPPALAMGMALKDGLDNAFEKTKLDDTQKQAVYSAMKKLTQGKYTKPDGSQGVLNYDVFAARSFDRNINDVITEAKRSNDSFKNFANNNEASITQVKNSALDAILEPARKKYTAATLLLTLLPGNPTNYAGDELGESGFDNPKLFYVQHRNLIHWDRKDKNSSNYVPEVAKQHDNISKIMNLRNDKAFSPLVNGDSIVLTDHNKGKSEEDRVFGIYRYNDQTDLIALFNKKGFGPSREAAGMVSDESVKLDYIDLSQESNVQENPAPADNNGTSHDNFSVLANLQENTVYRNALEKDNSEYKIVIQDGKKVIKKYENGKSQPIEMKAPSLLLYREKTFDGKDNQPELSHNINFDRPVVKQNTQVALANLKVVLPQKKQAVLAEKPSSSKTITSV